MSRLVRRVRRALAPALAGAAIVSGVLLGVATPALAGPTVIAAVSAPVEAVAIASPLEVAGPLEVAPDPGVPSVEFSLPPALIIGIVTGAIIPALVALISRIVERISAGRLSSLAKGLVLSALAALSGILTTVGDKLATPSEPIDLGVLVLTFVSSFVVGVTAYFGLLSRPASSGQSVTGAIAGKPPA